MPTELKPPTDLRKSGRQLWRSVAEEFELPEHERAQLVQACRLVDLLDDLAAVIRKEGVTVIDAKTGATVPHACVIELRQQRTTLARLLASLRIPDADDNRQQRRGAARGFYSLPGAS